MAINYIEGIKPGAKIDLSAFEKEKEKKAKEKILRPEIHLERLKNKLVDLSKEVNCEFGDFLDENGQINLVGTDSSQDAFLVSEQEKGFANDAGKKLTDWRRDKEINPASLTEMALTVVLHKFLKDDYIIARASAYDDYNNGIDQVIIDKKSGAVICGVDEVITYYKDGSAPKKEEKLSRKMAGGGARLKYGATVIDGRLARRSLNNIPAFYLALTNEDLLKLLSGIEEDDSGINVSEIDVLTRLISSLEDQLNLISGNYSQNQNLGNNLVKFKDSLNNIKSKFSLSIAS
ncbi:MAG: hypothetical protein WC146_00465 [Patescibacteria group bacterium]